MSLDILYSNIQKCLNIETFSLHLRKVQFPKASLHVDFQFSFWGKKKSHLSFHQKLKFSFHIKSSVNVFLSKLVIIFS